MVGSGERERGLTLLQACLSVANVSVGAGLLSVPYAMALSGSSGFVVIALCCLLFTISGIFISWGLDLLPPGVSQGYPELGYAAFGASGRHMVTFAAGLELFGGACMEIIFLWKSLGQLLPNDPPAGLHGWVTMEGVAILLGCLVEIPLCLFGTFKSLSYFSAAGVLSTCSVMALVVALPILDPTKASLHEDVEHHTFNPQIAVATGIISTFAAHSTFPSIRTKMSNSNLFPAALTGAYIITLIVVCSIGGVGYWYWGDSAQNLVTDDFTQHSPYKSINLFGVGIDHVVQAIVAVNVGTTVPLLLLPLADILQSLLATCRKNAEPAQTDNADEPLLPESQHPGSHTTPSNTRQMLLSRDVGGAASRVQVVALVASHVEVPFREAADPHDSEIANQKGNSAEAFCLRAALLVSLILFAATTRKNLAKVEAVVGAVCVVLSSLLLPTLFYMAIRFKQGNMEAKLWILGAFMVVFSVCLMTKTVAQNIMKLL